MNKIFKVIYSKVRNCYVVTSEFAKANTKSSTGSAKQTAKKSLLSLAIAMGIACGGFVNVGAVDEVEVSTTGSSTATVYTKEGTDEKINALAGDVTTNKDNITALQKKTVNLSGDGKKLTDMTAVGGAMISGTKVNAGELKVAGQISDGTVTTTLEKIDASMKQTETNKGDIADLKTKTGTQQAWIGKLKDKTTEISYAAGDGTTISGVRITDGNIVGNGNSAITGLTNVETNNINGKSLAGTTVATVKEVADAVKVETDARTAADTALEEKITKNSQDIATLDGKVTTAQGDIQTNANNIQANSNAIADTNKRTGGIARSLEGNQTTIEESVKVDKQGNVKDVNELSAKKITTTADADLKGNVILGTNTSNTVTVKGKSDFNEAVNMDNGLTVTNGDTTLQNTDVKGALNVSGESNLKNTTVDGTLSVNKETTLNGKLTAKDEATFKENVTMEKDLEVKGELKTDKISMKNTDVDADGTIHGSATTITADGITHIGKVEKSGVITKSQFTHTEEGSETYAKKVDTANWTETRSDVKADGVTTKVEDSKGNRTNTSQTADGIKGYVTDKDGNKTYTKVTATENSFQVQDKDGKNKNHQVNTMGSSVTEITNADGKTTKTEQTATDITNIAEQGTIKNDAKNIVNNATGDMTNTVGGKLTTNVTGQATENFNGGLDTNVTGTENHTVTGDQNIHVTGKQTNKIDGAQENTIGGNQTTNVTGDISNKAENITNEANTKLTDKVGDNTRVLDSEGITDTVPDAGGKGSTFKQRIDAIMGNVKTDAGESEVTQKGDEITSKVGLGEATNSRVTQKKDMIESAVTDGTNTNDRVDTASASAKKLTDGTRVNKLQDNLDSSEKTITNGTYTTSKVQTALDITNTAKDGTIKNDAKDIVTNASNSITEKVGETNVTTKTTTSSKSEIQNADTITSVQQTDSMVQSYVGKKDGSATNVTTNFADASANMVTKDGQTSTVLNNKDGLLVRNTANGSSFTTADGTNTGTAQVWTNVKGNEISTGKVEANYVKMDYADVMKDLGVRGNANIAGKTTTGSLEVKGESKLTGDVTMESNATVKKDLTVEGTTTTKTLKVTENATVGGTLDVAKKATFQDAVDIAKDLSVGGNATITGDVTAKSYQVEGKTYIDKNGINANNQKVTNVADGAIAAGSTDAVNGGQLFETNRRIDQFDSRINEVGANAAAMANLHPMEFDADSKLNVAVGVGNYRNKTATAMGLFYRPNEDVMFNVSSTIGSSDNMIGGGVSFRLGSGGNKLKNKAFADAVEQNKQLKSQVDTLQAQMDALLSVINPNMSKDFPDVPDNHWAYEAVSRLAGNDIIQGYEDGKYHGERTMTRYEMAVIIYKALQKGTKAEAKLVEEFKPELKAIAAHEKA